MTQIFKNNASSRLAVAATATGTSIRVETGTGAKFPDPTPGNFFMVTIEDRRTGQIEICKCTARSSDTLTVTRAQENTLGQAFALGSTVSNRLTAGTIEVYMSPAPGSNQYYWETRDQFVSAISVGFTIISGYTYVAGGFTYLGKVGSTAIPDLPGVIPFGDVHVEHFGAKGDLVWEMKTFPTSECQGLDASGVVYTNYLGPYKMSGTNDLVAFQRADKYVAPHDPATNPNGTGIGTFYAESGGYKDLTGPTRREFYGYFIDGQFILESKLVSRRGYRNYLWCRNDNLYKANIWINSSVGGITGLSVIGQWCPPSGVSKPSGSGQMGPTITVLGTPEGEPNPTGGPLLYTRAVQNILTDLEVDVRFCRAGQGIPTGGGAEQVSSAAYHLAVAAGCENSKFTAGIFQKTNSNSNGLVLAHYGARYKDVSNPAVPGYGTPGHPYTNWHGMEIIETYHCCDCQFYFPQNIDVNANPHGLQGQMFYTAASGSLEVSDISCVGVAPCAFTSGDIVNEWATRRQKDKVQKGIRVGYVTGVDAPNNVGPRVGTGAGVTFPPDPFGYPINSSVACTSIGGSQHLFDKFPGTERQMVRQIDVDIQFKGMYLARLLLPPAWNARSLYAVGCLGKLNFGSITTWGFGRGTDIQFCDGDQQVNYIEGDGTIAYSFSRGGRILQTDTDKGNVPGDVDDGQYGPGYAAGTRAVSVIGYTYQTQVNSKTVPGGDPVSLPAGTTKTPIVPFVASHDDVYVGTPIKIGNVTVTSTDYTVGKSTFPINLIWLTNTNPAKAVMSVLDICRLFNTPAGKEVELGVTISGASGDMAAANGQRIIRNIQYNTNAYDGGISRGVCDLHDAATGLPINLSAGVAPVSGVDMVAPLPGLPYILHTPTPVVVNDGAYVTVDESCRVKQLSLTSAGGESGLKAQYASVDNLDMHGLRWAGKFGANLVSARTSISGPLPLTVGRDWAYTGRKNTITGDAHALCSVKDSTIMANPAITSHFFMDKIDSGGGGHVDLRNCRIEDLPNLVHGTGGTKRFILSMYGCTDVADNRLLGHPARQGSNISPEGAVVHGHYHYADDGMLNCWVNDLVTDAAGDCIWVFPVPFSNSTLVSVTTMISSGTLGSGRIVYMTNISSVQAVFKAMNVDNNLPAAVGFHARAVGRWYAE